MNFKIGFGKYTTSMNLDRHFLRISTFALGWRVSPFNREVRLHVYDKRQKPICTTWPSFSLTCCLLFIFSTHKLVVSRNLLSTRIVLSYFNLLIFYFKKFSTWIWRLPLAVYVKLKLGSLIPFLHHDKLLWNSENNNVLTLQKKSPLVKREVICGFIVYQL